MSTDHKFNPVAERVGATVTAGGVTGRLLAAGEGGGPTLTREAYLSLTVLPVGERLARTVTVPADTTVEVTT